MILLLLLGSYRISTRKSFTISGLIVNVMSVTLKNGRIPNKFECQALAYEAYGCTCQPLHMPKTSGMCYTIHVLHYENILWSCD